MTTVTHAGVTYHFEDDDEALDFLDAIGDPVVYTLTLETPHA